MILIGRVHKHNSCPVEVLDNRDESRGLYMIISKRYPFEGGNISTSYCAGVIVRYKYGYVFLSENDELNAVPLTAGI